MRACLERMDTMERTSLVIRDAPPCRGTELEVRDMICRGIRCAKNETEDDARSGEEGADRRRPRVTSGNLQW